MMLILLFCAVVSEFLQPGIISQAHYALGQTNRIYRDAPVHFLGQVLIMLFRLGTIALAVYLAVHSGERFGFGSFALIVGWVIAVLIVKMGGTVLVDYTFQISRRFSALYSQYNDIATMTTCLLYPCLLFTLRLGNPTAHRAVLAVSVGLFIGLWTYRVVRSYMKSPAAILYIALYICTLEVLPIAALIYLSSITIASI